jgi:hypothetical protein
LFPEGAREPRGAGTGCRDEDEWLALGLQRPDKLVEITRSGLNRAEGDDCRTIFWGHIGDGGGLFRDIHDDVERASL